MRKSFFLILIIFLMLFSGDIVKAQESIFHSLKSDMKKAEDLFFHKAYKDAIIHYKRVIDNSSNFDKEVLLKIADSHYLLNDMSGAVKWYMRYEKDGGEFNRNSFLRYINSLQANNNLDRAISLLNDFKSDHPDDIEVSKKIWQLQNIHYLYEDSIFYSIKPIAVNSTDDEFGPVIYHNSIIFASNRDQVQSIKRLDATANKPFFNWYVSATTIESLSEKPEIKYSNPLLFGNEISAKYHKGCVHFMHGGDTMAFVRTSDQPAASGRYSLKLYFARKHNDQWDEYAAFPYNSNNYSVNHPFISENGKSMYFTSDMPGGFGGTDIYLSEFINGKWSTPKNLGSEINTSQNEGHPFVQSDNFYFSSDGHPGLGGIDVFYVNNLKRPLEVVNPGYPVNSSYDDFGLVLDRTGKTGYLVSNRAKESGDDDIYEVHISKLSYPIAVQGKISYRTTAFPDSGSGIDILPNAQLELIHVFSEQTVLISKTDSAGNFSIKIPFEGKFLLRVSREDFGAAFVSMEIPRNSTDYLDREIVIVKD